MSGAVSPVTGRPYGLAAVCRVWRMPRATIYRHRAPPRLEPPRRPGRSDRCRTRRCSMRSAPSWPTARSTAKATARCGRGCASRGVRTSRRRVLRLMRENDLLAPSRVGAPRGPRSHDGTIIPDDGRHDVGHRPDHDDHRRGPGGGVHRRRPLHRRVRRHPRRPRTPPASRRWSRSVRACAQHFGGFAKDVARGLSVRHDHGSQYMSDAFQNELRFLGIESSPAFVRAPEGNGCAERFIRTLKENLLWVRTFETIEELRLALLEFRETYNTTWLIERHGFITPAAVRQNQLQPAALAA